MYEEAIRLMTEEGDYSGCLEETRRLIKEGACDDQIYVLEASALEALGRRSEELESISNGLRANYRNIEKNIGYEPIYLERFFRNLLLSEQWDLRNRFVHVRPAAEWSTQTKVDNNTSTGQVQVKKEECKVKGKDEKKPSKADAVIVTKQPEIAISPNFLPEFVDIIEEPEEKEEIQPHQEENNLDNPNLLFLTVAIGEEFLSVKDIMERLHLKGRDNFLKLYLTPAVDSGMVSLLYPNSPRHPRQKYLLTQKGLAFLNTLEPNLRARIERHLANSRA